MARKRYTAEDALKILRENDVHLQDGLDLVSACRKAGFRTKPITIGARSSGVWDGRSFPR